MHYSLNQQRKNGQKAFIMIKPIQKKSISIQYALSLNRTNSAMWLDVSATSLKIKDIRLNATQFQKLSRVLAEVLCGL